MGTDSGVAPHGQNLRELELMVGCGMTPAQALVATTRTAAELMGLEDELGTLRRASGPTSWSSRATRWPICQGRGRACARSGRTAPGSC